MRTQYTKMSTPVGEVIVAWSEAGLVGVYTGKQCEQCVDPVWEFVSDLSCPATTQLADYFQGHLRTFDLPLVLTGTPFQQRVWRSLADIPFGETISYGELATRIGRPSAVRAVGAANGRNPISIVLPCHRVIGSDGSLTGYGGGLEVKSGLLELERRVFQPELPGVG